MAQTTIDSISLYCREGSTDKVYHAQIVGSDAGGYMVKAQNGRRGGTLTPRDKTPSPVSLERAKAIFAELVKSKLKDRYTPGADGTPYAGTEYEDRKTGVSPQLLNEVDESDIEALLDSPLWAMQEKFNGERRPVIASAKGITGANRKGLSVPLPQPIHDALAQIGRIVLDSEQVGDVLHVFDILEHAGEDLRALPYEARLARMYAVIPGSGEGPLRAVATARNNEEKRKLLARVRAENGEGVVFKRLDAPVTPNCPASGGPQLKFPFRASATVVVLGMKDGVRSAYIAVIDEHNETVPVGSVTIPPNADLPSAGDLLEVRYLYAYKGGSLFQPVYQFPRTDVGLDACTISQLKYKPDDTDDEDATALAPAPATSRAVNRPRG